MKKRTRQDIMLLLFIGAFLALLCVTGARSEAATLHENAGTSHSVLGAIGMDARADALGWAVTSLDMGVAGLEFNPASLGPGEGQQISIGHSRWVLDIPLDQFLWSRPFRRDAVFALGVTHMDMGSVPETLEDGAYTGRNVGGRDLQVTVGYSQPVHPMVKAGLKLTMAYKSLGEERAGTFMGSFGLLSQEVQGIRLGAALLDVGPPLRLRQKMDPSPWRARVGASYRLELDDGHRLLHSLDLVVPRDNFPSLGLGLEWTWNDMLALRLGYRRSIEDDGIPESDRFHYGAGINVDGFRLDYSFGARTDFQPVHRMGLTFDFGGGRGLPSSSPSPASISSDDSLRLARLLAETPAVDPLYEVTVFTELAFDAEETSILPVSSPQLDELYARLMATPQLAAIEIQGYVEPSGYPSLDRDRSLRRVRALRAELVDRGWPAMKIGLMAYGSDRPEEGMPGTRIEVHVIR